MNSTKLNEKRTQILWKQKKKKKQGQMWHFHVFCSSYAFQPHIEKQKSHKIWTKIYDIWVCVSFHLSDHVQTISKLVLFAHYFSLEANTELKSSSSPDKVERKRNFFMDSLWDYHNWQHTNERKYICRKIETQKKKRIKSDNQRIEIENEQEKKKSHTKNGNKRKKSKQTK